MSQSTPGPWRCNLKPEPEWYPWPESIEIEGGGKTIAWLTSNAKQRNLDEANARLIAAAPDMLAALEVIASVLPSAAPGANEAYVLEKARAAIAKATGAP